MGWYGFNVSRFNRLKNVDLRVFSILPSRDKALNEKIKKLNKELENLFENFINIYDNFLIEDRLGEIYSIDNVHLNGEGYVLLNGFIAKEIFNYKKPQGVKNRFLEYIKWYNKNKELWR